MATSGFVCSLIGVVLALVPVIGLIGWPLVMVGLALSAVGLGRSSARGRHGLAVAGLVLAIVGVVVLVINTILTVQTAPTGGNAPPSSSSVSSANAPGTSRSAADQRYLSVLDQNGVPYSTEDNAITAAYATCTFFDQGATVSQAAGGFMAYGYSPYQSGLIVGDAVASYCPRHLSLVQAASY